MKIIFLMMILVMMIMKLLIIMFKLLMITGKFQKNIKMRMIKLLSIRKEKDLSKKEES